ncbi:hypothetical protein [Isoptericola sp. NPDC056605]
MKKHAYTVVDRAKMRATTKTRDEAQAVALAHLASHMEVAG